MSERLSASVSAELRAAHFAPNAVPYTCFMQVHSNHIWREKRQESDEILLKLPRGVNGHGHRPRKKQKISQCSAVLHLSTYLVGVDANEVWGISLS
jgi:hypothetical protein